MTCISVHQINAQVTQNTKGNARATITGKITDVKGAPLQGVTIYFSDLKMGSQTENAGVYILRNISSGHHIVEIWKLLEFY